MGWWGGKDVGIKMAHNFRARPALQRLEFFYGEKQNQPVNQLSVHLAFIRLWLVKATCGGCFFHWQTDVL